MSVGQNIRKVRELKNLTQSYVARQLGITVAAYSRIERDRTNIGLKRLRQIAAALDTDAATILNFREQEIFGIQALITEIRLLREEIKAKR
ncbi:helix-turn-helix domain-containing protein [Chitinophaga lutea]|nr:helix-turn-helix transcriptional regulator [Chitinophaga lutea]